MCFGKVFIGCFVKKGCSIVRGRIMVLVGGGREVDFFGVYVGRSIDGLWGWIEYEGERKRRYRGWSLGSWFG